ncbi:MAG: hypothetical protein KHZ77_07925 [Veillonella sp.]|uniref:hypothetical protein n=1 Tax=Veillonella sp. TaxID=1926307 RepID=UPI0025D36C53|nr:hypothetical protein [Veillonella sp.]MBS4914060.1 hypothetical protein [Veillonella sp.]
MDITAIAKRLEEWGFRKEDIPKMVPLIKEAMGEETDSGIMVCRACQAVEHIYLGRKMPERLTHLGEARLRDSEDFPGAIELFYELIDFKKKCQELKASENRLEN